MGLHEVLDEDYLEFRHAQVRYLGVAISEDGVPIMQPPGGHAVYIDAATLLPDVPPVELPGQTVACELYLEGGIRSVEVGTVMFGFRDPDTGEETPASMELVRPALPRRVYTQSHVNYMVEAILSFAGPKESVGGFRLVEQEPVLRHFTARFEPLYSFGAG